MQLGRAGAHLHARGALLLSRTQASVADFGRQMLASDEPREHRPHLCRLPQPQTKRASAGRCLRLLPIVQGEQLASPPHDGRFAHYARTWCAVEIVQANGLELAYERVGEGPPLVFIHGAAEDSGIWR